MLRLPREAYDAIVDRAREGAPEEVCGVLVGDHGDESAVRRAIPTDNAADAPRTRYEIDPEELYAVIEDAEDDGDAVVGFYHSHPEGPARPSGTDLAQATWTGYSYLIVDLAGEPFVGSWRYTGESFSREVLRLE